MDRKEFLAQLGLGSTAIFAATCMQSCSKSDDNSSGGPGPGAVVDFTLDLSSSANAALKTPGGYVVYKGVIVALATNGSYLAVSAACPHEGVTVEFKAGPNQFYCARHGSYFESNGKFISGPANGKGLTQYKTTLTGNSLRVFS